MFSRSPQRAQGRRQLPSTWRTERGEERKSRATSRLLCLGQGQPEPSRPPARVRDSAVPCVAFVAEEPLFNMFYLGGCVQN